MILEAVSHKKTCIIGKDSTLSQTILTSSSAKEKPSDCIGGKGENARDKHFLLQCSLSFERTWAL